MVRNAMEPTTITARAFVRVVIVDDTSLVRERLKALLHADAPERPAKPRLRSGSSWIGVRTW